MDRPDPPQHHAEDQAEESPDPHLSRLTNSSFREWYRRREFAKNIRDGQYYFNGPPKIQASKRHSPSKLLQCHRRAWYNHFNSPEESGAPDGIFWFGSRFEDDIIMSYLADAVVGEETYVCNSLWVDYTIDTDAAELRIKGETDPVIVDETCSPLLLLEIKTKRSIENLSEPDPHHRAQIHAYLYGLSEKYDRGPQRAAIVYGSRTTLEIKVFEVEFDEEFWTDRVLSWARDQTKYRTFGSLPPAEPKNGWECDVCSYAERCGRGTRDDGDHQAIGLLPVFPYPRSEVVEYLDSHPGAKLTPTLAHVYRDLVDEYEVYRWSCSNCDSTFQWDEIDLDTESLRAPRCPECNNANTRGWLSGPATSEQMPREVKV